MAYYGRKNSPESNEKRRLAAMGKKLTKATRLKISQSLRGIPKAPEHIEKLRLARFQYRHSQEAKDKLSKALKGRFISESTRAKIARSLLGNKNNLGCRMSNETKAKIGLANKGEQNGNWINGASNEPYPLAFNEQLKETIRIRDNRACQLCGVTEDLCPTSLAIHHINYEKENILPMNLISLCIPCNGKANGERVYYQMYFEAKIKEIYKCQVIVV